jgi:hypothetical protein
VDSSSSLEVQIELSQNSLKTEEKGQERLNGDKILTKGEQTNPLVATVPSTTLVPEPSPDTIQGSLVTSSQVS